MTRKQEAQQLLTAVTAAIREIVAGAVSATISAGGGSQSYTRADLATLNKMRNDLRVEIASYSNGGRRRITMSGVRYV